jgi:hypothetical protein
MTHGVMEEYKSIPVSPFVKWAKFILAILAVCILGTLVFTLLNLNSKVEEKTTSNTNKEFGLIVNDIYNSGGEVIANNRLNVEVIDNAPQPATTKKKDNSISTVFSQAYFITDPSANKFYNIEKLKAVATHELGHVLTLQDNQFSTMNTLSGLDDGQYKKAYLKEEKNCAPDYYNTEGCYKSESYISQFYRKFWVGDLKESYDSIQNLDSESKSEAEKIIWNQTYKDKFISYNALFSPEEDFAESFSFWVLGYQNLGVNSIIFNKLEFFNSFPELVGMKERLLYKYSNL